MSKENNSRIDTHKKSKKKWLLYILIPISILILSVGTYGGYLYIKAGNTVKNSYEDIGRDNETSELREDMVDPIKDNVSILIIGVDDSERRQEKFKQQTSRSDTLMLATFNKQRNDVKLLSIPRDSHVYVPEVDYYTKINHAHAFGGHRATIETVENFLNVPVDYFVRVDFDAFIDVIDSLGGIYFNVPYEMVELNSKEKLDAIHLMPGYQKLDGEEALAVARTRKYDSDIQRGERQQEIIKAIIKEVASASSVLKLDNLMDAVGSNMTTNLRFNDMKSFMSYGLEKNVPITSIELAGESLRLDDGLEYYKVNDESREEVESELRAHLNLPIMKKVTPEFTAEEDLQEQDEMETSY